MSVPAPNGFASKWHLFAAFVPMIALMVGGAWTLGTRLNTVEVQLAAAERDLDHTKVDYALVLSRLGDIRSEQTRTVTSLIEIETQFCSQDNIRNLTHAADLRLMAMLWKKTFGDELPTANAFYARIGRCQAGG